MRDVVIVLLVLVLFGWFGYRQHVSMSKYEPVPACKHNAEEMCI